MSFVDDLFKSREEKDNEQGSIDGANAGWEDEFKQHITRDFSSDHYNNAFDAALEQKEKNERENDS